MKLVSAGLPLRSTALDTQLVDVTDSRSRYGRLARRIIDVRYGETIPADLLPWLLRDWGLEDAAAFVDDWDRLYREGKRWQRQRGTWAALDTALAWLDQAGARIEEIRPGSPRWALYQIELPRAPDLLEPLVPNVVGLSKLSAGAKSVLTRIHAGFDKRAATPDFARLDDCLLDFDSGVVLRPEWPRLSFGRVEEAAVDMSALREIGTVDAVSALLGHARYVDDVMLDWSDLYFQYPSQFRDFQIGRVDSFEWTDGARRDQDFETNRIIKAGIILDKQWPVESLQSVFPGARHVRQGHDWLADGFSPAHHTAWTKLVPIEVIEARLYPGWAVPMPEGTVTTFDRVNMGGPEIVRATHDGGETLLGSNLHGAAEYDGQSWVDLVVPEDATWNDIHMLIGTQVDGDPDE